MPTEPPVPCPTEEQREGYLVVRTCEAMAPWTERMMRSWVTEPDEWWAWLRNWHDALGIDDASRYAGVERDVLGGWLAISVEDREIWRRKMPDLVLQLPDNLPDARASRLLTTRLGPDPALWWSDLVYDGDLMPDESMAAEILAACDAPADRELVRVRRTSGVRTPATLGWDVGQWGGSHMSLLRDCFVLPCLHPPPDAALPELRAHRARLNDNLLFDRIDDAQAFLDWYLPHDWAESFGPKEVHVIQVERVPVESA